MRDAGVTIVLLAHDMHEVEHVCDRVVPVDPGLVVAIDVQVGAAVVGDLHIRRVLRVAGTA